MSQPTTQSGTGGTWHPSFEDVANVHLVAMEALGERPRAIIDRDKIESALGRPRSHAWYSGADLASQAAYLIGGLAAAHGFEDANKRTALAVTELFLEMNGYVLSADRALEDMLVDLVFAGSRQQDESLLLDALADGIRERLTSVESAIRD